MTPTEIMELASRHFEILRSISSKNECDTNDLKILIESNKKRDLKGSTLYNHLEKLADAGLVEKLRSAGKSKIFTFRLTEKGKISLEFLMRFTGFISPPEMSELVDERLGQIIDGLNTELKSDYKSMLLEVCRTEPEALSFDRLRTFFKSYISGAEFEDYVEGALRLTLSSIAGKQYFREWFKENLLSDIISQIGNRELRDEMRNVRAYLLIELLNCEVNYFKLSEYGRPMAIEAAAYLDEDMRNKIINALLKAGAEEGCGQLLSNTIDQFIEGQSPWTKVELKRRLADLRKRM